MTIAVEAVAAYRDQGFLHVPGLLTRAEAADLRAEAHALLERLARAGEHTDAAWGSARGAAPGVAIRLQHCHDVQFHSAAFARLLLDPRFTGVAAALLGTPNVQLHHTKLFIKPPEQGAPFPLHQDYPYFPHARHTMMAAIVHFDDAPHERGCLAVIPGSHKRGPLPHEAAGNWHLPPAEYPLESATPVPAAAGDAIFFNYLTIHGSGLNQSTEPRTTLLVQMRDPEDRPTEATHESRGQGMMLAGIDPLAPA